MGAKSWVEDRVEVDDKDDDRDYVGYLADKGVLAEAEQLWEAEGAGANPCDSVPLDEVLERIEAIRKR